VFTRKDSEESRASAMKAGIEAPTMTSTLQGESRQSKADSAARVTVFCAIPKACITRDSGRDEASRRAFCILS
jgi:hypothetical protein